MGKRSRDKGARGEREWAAWLRENGWPAAHRGRQYYGHPDAPDVADTGDIFWEVKRVERFQPYIAMAQAVGDCGERVPAVATKRNGGEWCVFLRAQDIVAFARSVVAAQEGD